MFAGLGLLDHQFVDERLRRGLAATAFAHPHDAHMRRDELNNGVTDQVVDQDHGGGLQGLEGLEGEQIRVSWTGADQANPRSLGGGG